jgi:uncharacterized membrane protein
MERPPEAADGQCGQPTMLREAEGAASCLHRVYLVVGIVFVAFFAFITPPFQVPDEGQHFHRAYQISELGIISSVREGAAGDVIPSSLVESVEWFLGTRAIHADRQLAPMPLRRSLSQIETPLDASRREFVDFRGAAFYSPLSYLPQALAIAAGRSIGLGPLELLWAGRLANGVAAIIVVAFAVRATPIGKGALLAAGAMPMSVYLFASLSPDASVIAACIFLTALGLRAAIGWGWTHGQTALAMFAGLVALSVKPVYAPLLLLGFAGAKRSLRASLVQQAAIIVLIGLGVVVWFSAASPSIVQLAPNTDPRLQIQGILADPLRFLAVIATTFLMYGVVWLFGLLGFFGWLTFTLSGEVLVIVCLCILLTTWLATSGAPTIPPGVPAWFLLMGSCCVLLVLLSGYVAWNPVGDIVIAGIQGRYFLPVLPCLLIGVEAVFQRNLPALNRPLLTASVMALPLVLTIVAIGGVFQVFGGSTN